MRCAFSPIFLVGTLGFAFATTSVAQTPPAAPALATILEGPTAVTDDDEGELQTVTLLEYLSENYPVVAGFLSVARKIAIVSLIFLPFQLLFPLVRRKPKVFTAEFWLDVVYWYQGFFWSALSVMAISTWAAGAVWGNKPWFPVLATTIPSWLQVILAIWCFDFVVYWRHRFEHTVAPLWWFHATHHTSARIDPLTTFRVHVGELVLGGFLNGLVLRIGLHPEATATAFAIYLGYNYFIHSNVNLRMPGLMKYVLVTPFMHQWHHAMDAEARNKNFGVVFAWNDWIFGTAYHPQHAPTRFGIEAAPGEEVNGTFFGHLLYPLKMMLLTVRRWVAQPAPAKTPAP